jgi:hypothetical protein
MFPPRFLRSKPMKTLTLFVNDWLHSLNIVSKNMNK